MNYHIAAAVVSFVALMLINLPGLCLMFFETKLQRSHKILCSLLICFGFVALGIGCVLEHGWIGVFVPIGIIVLLRIGALVLESLRK